MRSKLTPRFRQFVSRSLPGCAVAALMGCLQATVHADHVRIFLLAGQSNMLGRAPSSGLPTSPVDLQQPQADVLFYYGSSIDNGTGETLTTLRPGSGKFPTEFGPEVTFGRAVADASPNLSYALIKYAAGGTSLYEDWDPSTGPEYANFLDTVAAGRAALHAAGHTTEIAGMLFHQGENDAIEGQQANYGGNLTAFIADVRSRFGSNLPFLIGEIRRSNGPAFVTVADAQAAVAAADPHSTFVPASDLTFLDTYHFDAAGQQTLGYRFAAAYVKEFLDRSDLAAGGYHVVRVDGAVVKGLGDGTYGQLGTSPAGAPATVVGLSDITDVAAGGFSTLALKSDGTVWFLGESTLQHTTPHGTPNPVATPVQVPGLAGIDAIAAGHRHYLALDTDTGNLYAWGHNGSGQVGNGGLLDVTIPALVLTGVTAMSAGDGFSLAVKTDQTLWAWGGNSHGQLGLGDTVDRFSPTQVPGVAAADAVAAGGRHSLILLAGGTILAMGNNEFGQLGLGTTTPTSTPTAVPGLSGVTSVSAGYFHSAAYTAGQVSVWGRNFEGQCGGGASSAVNYPAPQVLAGLSGTPTGVRCGYHFTLVELADGSVVGTGSNSDGQLDGSSVADQDDSQKILAPQVLPISPDLSPPSPNPMSFASPPAPASASSITMTATTASDPSGPVEYFFDCTTPGGHDSGWQAEPTYIDTGLATGVSYIYQVKARDAVGNETAFSAPASAAPEGDVTSPGIASLSPANGASGVALNTSLVLSLDESVQKGAGNIRIKESLGNEIVATIDITSGTVTIDNGQVTIVPPAILANGTAYYIEIDGGALADLSGNPFGGIAGSQIWSFTTAVETASADSLIAHYTFDVDDGGTTPDSVGIASAALGGRVRINATVSNRLGSGALEMLGGGNSQGPVDGAVTSNTFAWDNDARTVTFWWRARNPNVNTSEGTFVSFGTEPASGARLDIKESTATNTMLRVEVQGTGLGTNPTNFDDGNWHFVAVTVPNNATFADIAWYVGVRGGTLSADLNTSTNTLAIATGSGPLAFGDSIVSTITSSTATNDRVPNGFLDEFQLYNEVLTPEQILFLYQNPGSVIGQPTGDFAAYVSDPAFGLDPADRDFSDDPDGDGLANGLEAWFGTHPGQFNAGITGLTNNGQVTTFTHPQNEDRPADVIGFYQWSPDLVDWYAGDGVDGPPGGPVVVFSVQTVGATTTVTATAGGAQERLFLRAGVGVITPSPSSP